MASRRLKDKELENAAMEAKARADAAHEIASKGLALMTTHVTDCARISQANLERLTELELKVTPMADYITAKLTKEQKRAEFWIILLRDAVMGALGKIAQGLIIAVAVGIMLGLSRWIDITGALERLVGR